MPAASGATATLAADAVVIDLDKTIKTNSPLMNGAHFSPLNHQIQVIYANMVFDESFEQSIATKLPTGNNVSMGWIPVLSPGAQLRAWCPPGSRRP